MPGANHNLAFDLAFGQGTAPVIAGVVNSEVAATKVKDGEAPTRDVYALRLSRYQVFRSSHLHTSRHGHPLKQSKLQPGRL